MKHVVSISLGSSKRDKQVEFQLGDQLILMERRGCDGDEKKAQALFSELDGQVDALGVGGVELYVRVGQKQYPLRSGLNLVKNVKTTPCVDGRGIKYAMERNVFQWVEAQLPADILPRKAMMPVAADRFALAESLDRAGFDLVFCDLMFGLGLPIPVRGLSRLRFLAGLLLPVIGLMPISMLYPTGQNQDEIVPRYQKWFNFGPVIAGDFLYIRRHLPPDLTGKIIITNTTTEADLDLLRSRGLAYLVTTTPRIDGRSFGTNMLEAALVAYAGQGRLLSDDELAALVSKLGLKPSTIKLN